MKIETPAERSIVLIAHNLRSAHNVGSLLRTAEGLGVSHVYLTGYTPHPTAPHDNRLPHIAEKIHKNIQKTALGAEQTQAWSFSEDIHPVLSQLASEGYEVCGVEQSPTSIALPTYEVPNKIALLVGREVEGVEPEVLALCPVHLEIPMFGKKESFNVAQAAAMTLFYARFYVHP